MQSLSTARTGADEWEEADPSPSPDSVSESGAMRGHFRGDSMPSGARDSMPYHRPASLKSTQRITGNTSKDKCHGKDALTKHVSKQPTTYKYIK